MMRSLFVFTLLYFSKTATSQHLRWRLEKNGSIEWLVKKGDTAHTDHIEMSGKQVSVMLTYGTDSARQLLLKKKVVFPMLRIIPNDTRGSLIITFDKTLLPVLLDGKKIEEQPTAFAFDGSIKITSSTIAGISLLHEIFPSADKPALIENYTFRNNGKNTVHITVPEQEITDTTEANKSVYGSYLLSTKIYGSGEADLRPGQVYNYSIVYSGRKMYDQPYEYAAEYESVKRRLLVDELKNTLVLKTPDDTLNQMFSFAKIRAAESIFDTKSGLMHGPGGGDYYAAIWANDQAEYMNPFFPFLGYAAGNQSAINSYRLFAKYINPEYKPIPSSIVAEGTDIWDGAGDRGDQAMIAYGASRFALAYGDTAAARRLWPLIEWCLEFLNKKKNAAGVIASDADELEGRFPHGKINLSTNTLAYGALISAADLARALGNDSMSAGLSKQAGQLKIDIEKYFGATVQGFKTYRYYEGNTTLRSWIGLPLVMGIFDRKDETLKALFSPNLWTKDGMLSESGSTTFWDRSLLYALRGAFYAGSTDATLAYLKSYSSKRLLGEHVPYAIEAWPEGDQRHLSAESGLYCRIITEGLFGLTPKGFNKFTLQPLLPTSWNEMSLNNIKAFNNNFDISVVRKGTKTQVSVKQASGKTQVFLWDGRKPLEVVL